MRDIGETACLRYQEQQEFMETYVGLPIFSLVP